MLVGNRSVSDQRFDQALGFSEGEQTVDVLAFLSYIAFLL
jgi:hypothetical protein